MTKPEILIIGGTGKIGTELVSLLVVEQIPVRLVVRTAAATESLKQNGIDVVQGDLNNRDSIESAVQDISTIFLLTRDQPAQAELESGLIDIARDAGVEKVVKSSAFAAGLQPPVGYGITHAGSEQKLKNSGLRWVILRPYMFMQNFLELAQLIHARRIMPLPMGKAKIALIDARDVALCAKTVLISAKHDNASYNLTGPDSLSMEDCANMLSNSLGYAIRYRSPPSWLAGLMMRKEGVSGWDVQMRKQLFRMIREGGEAGVTNEVENITGQRPRKFEQFIQDNLPIFQGAC